MDSIMEKNLRTFADWFMKQQEDYAEKVSEVSRLEEAVEAAWQLIEFAWLMIYDTYLSDSDKLEKIWNAINAFYDKYWKEDV